MAEITLETPEELREAIGVLAAEIVRLKEVIEANGELLKLMDIRITTLTKLIDSHQHRLEILEAAKKGTYHA